MIICLALFLEVIMHSVSCCSSISPFVRGGAVLGAAFGTVGAIISTPVLCRIWTHVSHYEDDELNKIANNTYEMFPKFLVDINDKRFETHWECTTKVVIFNTISTAILWAALGAAVGLGRHVFNKCRHGD